ncbi:PPK2 family polyphosphate kinase [Actinophytocola sp.]|uniref:PPK2 family polyphosphate kinase n=1 Tax=Actinophytocola sp. TaxID=1872138 RepID=UPI002D806805|nr:PPK2 family polyphosphate kinase [Actinophytocola sp.]HET9144416.1 PPK2 family polyphosphate kinase [Actinophytocola sp.]
MAKKRPSVRDALRVPAKLTRGIPVLPDDKPVGPTSKAAAVAEVATSGPRLGELQELLYAEGVTGGKRSVLVVLQGMDTSGKGGTIKHVCSHVNPQGLHIASFKKPSKAELRHHFLWRIRRVLPEPGYIGVFDRSHYEDVLVPQVNGLLSAEALDARYEEINAFEAELAEQGITLVKCFLHISPQTQRERLVARLKDPTKHWKYNPGDLDVRAQWSAYQKAYVETLRRCSTSVAPWYVVPADRKWYRNWAVGHLLLETLEAMRLQPPAADFDADEELARLVGNDPLN